MTKAEIVKKYFEKDEFVKGQDIEILEISAGQVCVGAKISPKHLNANGCVQGGMLYTVADFAFAVLGNYLHPATVTQSGKIDYIRAAYTTSLTAIATETARAGHTAISQVIVYDDQGQAVCVCNFNGFVKDLPFEEWTKKITATGEEK